jgi:hypothetical protein
MTGKKKLHAVWDDCVPRHTGIEAYNLNADIRREEAKRDPDSPLYEKTRTNAHPERDLQNAILKWLTLRKICHVRLAVNTSTIWVGGKPVRLHSTMKGWPDILCIAGPHGTAIGLEVKVSAAQSEDQKSVEGKITAARGVYKIVRSIEDVEKILRPYM